MRKLMLLVVVCLAGTGCADMVANNIVDNMTNNAIKMMEAQERINKERRAERQTIEGRVKSTLMSEREVPDAGELEKKVEGNSLKIAQKNKKIKYCVVDFVDGREKEFANVPGKPLVPNKYYKIEYNGLNEVVEVAEMEK